MRIPPIAQSHTFKPCNFGARARNAFEIRYQETIDPETWEVNGRKVRKGLLAWAPSEIVYGLRGECGFFGGLRRHRAC
jgi:hypothetical protein